MGTEDAEWRQQGWQELFRSADRTEAETLWKRLPETDITRQARLLEVEVLREYLTDGIPAAG